MNLFKKHEKHPDEKRPVPSKVRRGFRFYAMTVLSIPCIIALAMPAAATGGDLWLW